MKRNHSQLWLALTSVLIFSVVFTCAARAQSSTPVGKLPIAQLQKLAESGDPAAENELGVRYQLGFDVQKDPSLSMEWLRKAARQGFGRALFNIGAASYNGDGVAATRSAAMYWFLLAEDAGDGSGKQAVAQMQSEVSPTDLNATYVLVGDGYEKGIDIKQDYGRAMQWYRKAADAAGNAAACHHIALLYARGLGVQQDSAEIIHWLQRGADLGDPAASYDLGRAYERGSAVPLDLQKAIELYQNAALHNNAKAMFALGNLYNEGKGVTQDRQQALMWFILAAKYGDPDAGKQVTALSAELKPNQVKKAKQDAVRYTSIQKILH
jgi:TPR repeat protein